MRVAFAMINCNRRDGSARPVNEVAERLSDRGHHVDVYARKAEDLDLRKVNWHRIPGPGWPEAVDFATYHLLANRRLASTRHDIIHSIGCNTMRCNVVTIQNIQPAKKRILDRLSLEEQVSAPRRFTRWLYLRLTCAIERRLYTRSAQSNPVMFLPVSRGVEAELRQYYDIGSSAVHIIPNAADIEKFRPLSPEQREEWRRVQGVKSSDIVALFAGGEWSRKGLDLAIRALPLIHDSRIKLYVAGDDPERSRFMKMAQDSGCADRVIFGGFRQDMPQAMGSADLFLFPSWYEAFSLATIEAAACGLPVVATRINGTEDFIEPGLNGDFIGHESEDIAAVLNRLCSETGRLRAMGNQGRRLVEQFFTWDRVAAMTESAYLECGKSLSI